MRLPLICALMLSAAPAALMAAPIERPATVTAVTLFAQGAQVTRTVEIPAGAGTAEFLIPGLPDGTDAATLRVSGEGVQIGAVTLIDGRAPSAAPTDSPALIAARDRVAQLTAALADKTDAVAAIRAEAQAARAEAAFLEGASTQGTPATGLADLAKTVGQGVLDAERRAIAAEARARTADVALEPDRQALERAKLDLAALEHPARASDSLLVEASGKGRLTITTFVADAGWSPAYDLRLDGAGGKLGIERFATVHQASGEDWPEVALTLSTARPAEQTAASDLPEELVHSGPPMPAAPAPMAMRKADAVMLAAASEADTLTPELQGETLVYRYGAPVRIRDGVEALRLKLDALSAPVTEVAQAVPRLDSVAYRQIEGRNDGEEPLLPGPANLFVGDAMVGTAEVPLVAAGDKFSFGFGAIDGLRLKRIVPQASEGDRGLIAKSNARVEMAQISVENLTGRNWPVRLIDRVPYSEQDALKVSWKADPAPTETDWHDRRGVLAWSFDLPAGQSRQIALTTTIGWPAGEVLQ
ncbi:DUF4139 domain-containing protein [Paenirhodobacter enshiensis]|uniref:DUF4139 domain-containing protein n=1 Tax=Paenirhodobacter enshiensis TaxID=1105367 RepID=A0A086Y4D0_9RHOB|nr:DUF4139 domain-containing protein [Paenirhodobacter enshiensis]KFI29130.1 hypothetical protein CG50_13195 [Paenirhodobacter enshiensis]